MVLPFLMGCSNTNSGDAFHQKPRATKVTGLHYAGRWLGSGAYQADGLDLFCTEAFLAIEQTKEQLTIQTALFDCEEQGCKGECTRVHYEWDPITLNIQNNSTLLMSGAEVGSITDDGIEFEVVRPEDQLTQTTTIIRHDDSLMLTEKSTAPDGQFNRVGAQLKRR